MGAAAELVELAVIVELLVIVALFPPTICVKDTDLLDTVICEFEDVVMVAFELRVEVSAMLCVVPVR